MTDRTSVVADFWLAVARNNHEEAQNVVRRLDVPVVSISSAYSFEMVEGEEHLAEVEQEDTGARWLGRCGGSCQTPLHRRSMCGMRKLECRWWW
jgi:hypothetical protein